MGGPVPSGAAELVPRETAVHAHIGLEVKGRAAARRKITVDRRRIIDALGDPDFRFYAVGDLADGILQVVEGDFNFS